jgi:DNA mismatch repair protein MutS
MAGVPHHALEQYLGRLLKAGRKVAICDQLEDPSKAKGIVKRGVVRVVTPGTVFDAGLLEDRASNFLAAVARVGDTWGLAWADVSTGEFLASEAAGQTIDAAMAELARTGPVEVVAPEGASYLEALERRVRSELGATTSVWRAEAFHPAVATALLKERFALSTLEGLGLTENSAAAAAAGAALSYVEATQMGRKTALKPPRALRASLYMEVDAVTQRNLELVRSLRDGSTRGTLLALLDRCVTPMGGRRLRAWLLRPLMDLEAIRARQDAVAFLFNNAMLRERVRGVARGVHDVERLVSRTAAGLASPRELVALAASIEAARELDGALTAGKAGGVERPALVTAQVESLRGFEGLSGTLRRALVDEPPDSSKEGGLIRSGFSAELDDLKLQTKDAREWINGLQARERERTGLKGLKVGYNKVFGYYLELPRGQAGAAPANYERRQTLANAERYVTPELKEYEEKVLSADEQINALEERLFESLVREVSGACAPLLRMAEAVATLDVANTLAGVAADRGYARPQVDGSTALEVRDGRHPVVEVSNLEAEFVPNDTHLDTERNQLAVITGPNMAGKSTFMRQVALIALLAQVGSFVPAAEARIGIVDRILTRVGATDYVASGQSTFMVEMVETARILNLASDRSLVLLDEIGRGTSTFDGLSIAWAVAEYLHDGPGAHPRTLFATHYHQLTDLERDHARVVNYHLTAREHEGGIVFLRKLMPGSTDKSYGIQVAKLAGVPDQVIARASQILQAIEEQQAVDLAGSTPATAEGGLSRAQPLSPIKAFTQTLLFRGSDAGPGAHEALERLSAADMEKMSPLEALQFLTELQQVAKGEGPSVAAKGPAGKPTKGKRPKGGA